jgi:hypothetical protein
MRIGEILTPDQKQALLFAMYGHYDPEHRDLDLEEHELRLMLLRAQVDKHRAEAAQARAEAVKLSTS